MVSWTGGVLLSCCRVMRISAGSGRYPGEVVQLLDEHKRFSNMVGKMGKLGKGKGANWEQDMMKRNPKMMMQQLQGCMDPRMMQQVSGPLPNAATPFPSAPPPPPAFLSVRFAVCVAS